MKTISLLFLLFVLGNTVHAAGELPASFVKTTERISQTYFSGPFLIYDCKDKHYACVDESNKNACQEGYDKDRLLKKMQFSCVVIRSFTEKEKCEVSMLEIIELGTSHTYCQNLDGH